MCNMVCRLDSRRGLIGWWKGMILLGYWMCKYLFFRIEFVFFFDNMFDNVFFKNDYSFGVLLIVVVFCLGFCSVCC